VSAEIRLEPLPWRSLSALLLSMFVIAVGYGFLLPILPFVIERITGTADPSTLSRHTGLLTGAYTLALFLFAPLWGRIADRRGRRPVILLGLVGFAATLALFALADRLSLLYLGRLLNGLFASAITPAAYALVGDHAPSKEWRAHRFALLNISGASGFLVGPMLGGFTLLIARDLLPGMGEAAAFRSPFFVTSGFAFLVAVAVWTAVPNAALNRVQQAVANMPTSRAVLWRLLMISFVTAAAVGAFEVGLSLRGTQVLGMSTAQLGLMFTECSLVMLIVQSVVFSPLVKPDTTRWFLTPALAILGAGLAAVSFATTSIATAIAVALIAASAGILSPIVTYWISLGAGDRQGTELGRQTAAASLGQAVGSAGGGLLFGATFVPNASFTVTAAVVLASVVASIGIQRLLAQPRHDRLDGRCSASLSNADVSGFAIRKKDGS
jgi:DHA1 family multidrug resistance protein-like MFS transporter